MRSSIAAVVVACAVATGCADQADEARPFRLAAMAVPGLSLMRRGTLGYQPGRQYCDSGKTCAEACGPGYDRCGYGDGIAHCFSPGNGETCCPGGAGNSCEKGYYCASDGSGDTWCCPDGLDLAACAAARNVDGPLSAGTPTVNATSTATEGLATATSSAAANDSDKVSVSATEKATVSINPVSAPAKSPSTAEKPSEALSAARRPSLSPDPLVVAAMREKVKTALSSPVHAPALSGLNSTEVMAGPAMPSGTIAVISQSGMPMPLSGGGVLTASFASLSALLLTAAGVIALL